MYVIKRNEDGKYVARPGSKRSYTRYLQCARVFTSRDAAEGECCGNEHVEDVSDIVGEE